MLSICGVYSSHRDNADYSHLFSLFYVLASWQFAQEVLTRRFGCLAIQCTALLVVRFWWNAVSLFREMALNRLWLQASVNGQRLPHCRGCPQGRRFLVHQLRASFMSLAGDTLGAAAAQICAACDS